MLAAVLEVGPGWARVQSIAEDFDPDGEFLLRLDDVRALRHDTATEIGDTYLWRQRRT